MPKNTTRQVLRVEHRVQCWVDLGPGEMSGVDLRLATPPEASLPVTGDSQMNVFILTWAPSKA